MNEAQYDRYVVQKKEHRRRQRQEHKELMAQIRATVVLRGHESDDVKAASLDEVIEGARRLGMILSVGHDRMADNWNDALRSRGLGNLVLIQGGKV